jgi:hypothetical protein
MPFHVEINSPLSRIRVLNLDEAGLQETVLGPWVAGLPFEFGNREWAPRESRLTVLRGPALEAVNHPDAWESALRAAEDVTRPMLEAAEANAPTQTALVIEADSVDGALRELRAGRSPQQILWSTAAERVDNRDPEVTAVILVVKRPVLAWPKF